MDRLPSELVTIISSYLTEYQDLDAFDHVFESRINYTSLIVLNYPRFYHVNLKHYKPKYIYYDFIMSGTYFMLDYVPTFKNTAHYLIMNDLINPDNFSMKMIIKYDDVEIFKEIFKEILDEYITLTKIELCVKYNSLNILEYVLTLKTSNTDLYNFLISMLKDDDYSDMIHSIKMIISKIIIELLNIDQKLGLLTIHKDNKEIFNYILNIININISNDEIIRTRHRVSSVLIHNNIDFYYFKQFFDKYPVIFDEEYKLVLIKILMGFGDIKLTPGSIEEKKSICNFLNQ